MVLSPLTLYVSHKDMLEEKKAARRPETNSDVWSYSFGFRLRVQAGFRACDEMRQCLRGNEAKRGCTQQGPAPRLG